MITKEKLEAETAKNLAQMAVKQGVPGARGMRKEELIKKLLQIAKKHAAISATANTKAKKASVKSPAGKPAAAKPASAKPAARVSDRGAGAKPTRAIAVKAGSGSSTQVATGTESTSGSVTAKSAPAKSATIKAATGKSSTHHSTTAKSPAAKANSSPTVAAEQATTKQISQPKPSGTGKRGTSRTGQGANPSTTAAKEKLTSLQQQRASAKDLAFFRQQLSTSEEPKKDRLILFVRDPYWVQAYWEITTGGVERAKAALAEHWHTAVPVLRLLVNQEDSIAGASEQLVQEIKIHGGVNNWYIPVQAPPQSFRAVIGYLAGNGRFHALAQSNLVRTPIPGSSDHVDYNWTDLADIGDRVFSLSGGFAEGASQALREVFEEKLSRPMNRSALSRYGTADVPGKMTGDDFFVDAELLIFGKTHRSAEVSISGEPVKVREDGSFTVRVGLPDKRQVFPVSSTSFDGSYTFTTVLAIERNTKVMEPMSMEPGDDF